MYDTSLHVIYYRAFERENKRRRNLMNNINPIQTKTPNVISLSLQENEQIKEVKKKKKLNTRISL